MPTFVIDAGVALHLADAGLEISTGHEVEAPTLLRSQALSLLHEAVSRGELTTEVALQRLDHIRRQPIRLLGDAVLQRRAWRLATELGWAETYTAEYVALALLHKGSLITLDAELLRRIEGIVPTASIDAIS
jgi:predicted nucleic acid-binding protein